MIDVIGGQQLATLEGECRLNPARTVTTAVVEGVAGLMERAERSTAVSTHVERDQGPFGHAVPRVGQPPARQLYADKRKIRN